MPIGDNDFNGAKPVKTVRFNDFVGRIVGKGAGDDTGEFAAVVAEGTSFSAGDNDSGIPSIIKDKDGKALIPVAGDGGGMKVELVDAEGDELLISDDGEALVRIEKAQGAGGADAPDEAVQVAGIDSDGKLRVLKTTDAGELIVKTDDEAGVDVCQYDDTPTVGVGNPTEHDCAITTGKTFVGDTVLVGARGAVKVQVGTWDGTTFVPKYTWFQDPKENYDHSIKKLRVLGTGTNFIRVVITNLDGASSDVYSNVSGDEV